MTTAPGHYLVTKANDARERRIFSRVTNEQHLVGYTLLK
jgi:hypothetical protein